MANLTITGVKTLTKPSPKSFEAGEAISLFDLVYVDGADGKIYQAVCTSATKLAVAHIALTAGATGEFPTVLPLTAGLQLEITGATVVLGTSYVLSATAGKIAPLADLVATNYKVDIGTGLSVSPPQLKINVYSTGIQMP